jgi:ferredoxin
MAYVITELCVGTCAGECARVCPMDCIHGPIPLEDLEAVPASQRAARFPGLQLYIDPSECIDCGACADACPAKAILPDTEVPDVWKHAIEANAAFYRR